MTTVRVEPNQAPDLAEIVDRDDGATVVLGPGEYVVDPLFLRGSVSLVGEAGPQRTTVRPRAEGELLKIYGSGSSVLVRGLTLQGGRADAGGAIEVANDARLRIEQCVLRDNEALQLRGGAICAGDDVELVASCCVFAHNRSPRGGALAAGVAAKVRIDRCVFADNTAELGGALWASEHAELDVRSATFLGNLASHPAGGGALFVTGNRDRGPAVRLVNCLIGGERQLVNNPERPGEVSLSHCIVPPGTLAGAPLRDGGHNLDVQPDLVEVGPQLFALRAGAAGSGLADPSYLEAEAVDLRGTPLVHDGSADPGALASPQPTRQLEPYDSIEE